MKKLFEKIKIWLWDIRFKLFGHDPLVEIISFHAGMNRRVSPLLNKLEEARIARNADLSEIGTLKKAKGYAIFGNQPTGNDVLSLYPFYKIGATTSRNFLRDSGGNVYKYNFGTSTWDAITGATGLSSSVIPVWVTYKNLAMRFNGIDTPKKYDETNFVNLGGSPPNGSIPALYKDKIYISGVSPNYSTVYFCDTGSPETWPSFNNFDVNNNDGDRVMALVPAFDSLIIFKEFSLWEFQVDAKNNPSVLRYITLDIGTTSRRSIVNIGGIYYFFNRRGIYQFASRYPELISLKVQDFIDAVTDPYNVVAFKDGNTYNLFIGNVTVGGKNYNNCVLRYDTLQDTWTIRTLAHSIKAISDFIGSDSLLKIYFGSSLGKTFQWGEGYKYDTTPIEMEYETSIIQLGDPNAEKMLRRLIVRSSNLAKSPATIHCVIDGEDPIELGQINETIWKNDVLDKEMGKDIILKIHEVSDKEMREIYWLGLYYDEGVSGGEVSKPR